MVGKRVLITGGTKGIGKAVASCLARAGYNLILTYASDEKEALRVADDLLQQYNVDTCVLQADISDRKSIEKIESFLTERSMRLDVVIFNAGLTCRDPFEELDMAEWERVFFANVHFLYRIFDGNTAPFGFAGIRRDEECRACVGEKSGEVPGAV